MLHREKTTRRHACLDLCHSMPSYMHEEQAEKKCQTEMAKDKCNHGVAQNYPCVVIMEWVGGHPNDDELKRVNDAEMKLSNLYYFLARRQNYL